MVLLKSNCYVIDILLLHNVIIGNEESLNIESEAIKYYYNIAIRIENKSKAAQH